MRLVIWLVIFYLVYKIAKYVMKMLSRPGETNEQIRNDQTNEQNRKPYSINQKDIVEAKFEEIKEDKEKNKDQDKNSGE